MRGLLVTLSPVRCPADTKLRAFAQTGDAVPRDARRGSEARRDRKAESRSTPYQRNGLERGMEVAEQRLTRFLAAPDGVHPKFGSLATGSGFAFGAGYRNRRLLDREGALNVWAACSLKKVLGGRGRFDLPSLAGGRLTLGTYARHQNYPQEDFFGIGPDARRDDHTSFQIRNTMVGGRVGVKPARRLTVGRRRRIFPARTATGQKQRVPSIEDDIFDDTATGSGRQPQPSFARSPLPITTIGNRRTPAKAAGTGSRPAASRTRPTRSRSIAWMWISASSSAFWQSVACWRCASRSSTSEPAPGARVPFYLMPTSADTTRCAASATTAFGDRTRFSRRPSTASKSGRASTRRCSTTPARSPCDAHESQLQGSRARLRLRLPIQHGQRHDPADRRRVRQQ